MSFKEIFGRAENTVEYWKERHAIEVEELRIANAEIARLQEVVTNDNGKEWYRFWLMRGKVMHINDAAFEAGETDVLVSVYAKPQEVTK